MTELQMSLLILGAGVLLVVLLLSRRGRGGSSKREPSVTGDTKPDPVSELLGSGAPARNPPTALGTGPSTALGTGFDDFGVGKPRSRTGEPQPRAQAAPVPPPKPDPAVITTPAYIKATRTAKPEKLVTVYIAEREGTKINGVKVHAALEAQKLTYNELNKAYDRLQNGRALFSVTSLTSPGYLDRAQAATFSTPGLALFMRLPGPPQPQAVLRDMLATADALAKSLKAILFDAAHQPLNEDLLNRLAAEVDEWARRNP